MAGDVTAADFPQRCVEATVQRFGTIDILINNAGTTPACPTTCSVACDTPKRAAEESDWCSCDLQASHGMA